MITNITAVPSQQPWHSSQFQVDQYGTRRYIDLLPACPLGQPMTDNVPGFSSLKPAKPFRKTITVAGVSMTVSLDLHRLAEWMRHNNVDLDTVEGARAFYKAPDIARNAAFDRGHALHDVAERHLRGEPWTCTNAEAEPYIPHLVRWLDANVDSVHAIEAVVFGDGYGGTGDLWPVVRGTPVYLDFKSRGEESSHGIYEEEIAQGGAYTGANYIIVPNADRTAAVRAPLPPADAGIVLSLRPDGVNEYWYDLELAQQAFQAMKAAYDATSQSGKIARTAKLKQQPEPRLAPPLRASNLIERLKAVAATSPETAAHIRACWPADTPRLTDGGHTHRQLDQIERLVTDAEAELSMPFNDPAPIQAARPPITPRPAPIVLDPDEGVAATDEHVTPLRTRYDALTSDARTWIGGLVREGQRAGATFHLRQRQTMRTVRIMRGLITLAETDACDEQLIRSLVAHSLGDDVAFTSTLAVGAVVAMLNSTQAAMFAAMASQLAAGRLQLLVDNSGVMRVVDTPLSLSEIAERFGTAV